MASRKVRIVAVPLVAVGHATPMMHLCSYLSKKGFSISFVIGSGVLPLKDLIEQRGTWPPPGSDITVVQLGIALSIPKDAFVNGKLNITPAHIEARRQADELEKFIHGIDEGVSLILSEYQYSWVMDVAEKLKIPGAILFTGSSTWSWFDMNMPFLVSENLVPSKDELLPEEEDSVVCNDPLLRRSDIPWHFWGKTDFQDFTIKYNVGVWDKAKWVLVNSCEALEEGMFKVMKQRFGSSKYLPVGPLFLANEENDSVGLNFVDKEFIINWLDKQPASSVVYIAFGSLAGLPVEQLEEFALGLEASKQRFLWVVRTSFSAGFSDEDSEFYEKLLESGRGLIVPWAPQLEVLSHAATGAFLTHCGWNSTLEGVTNGQPMICWPCLFDQNINSRLIVEEWKIGAWLTKKAGSRVVDRKEVERIFRMVMEGTEGQDMRIRAKDLSIRVKEDNSLLNLESFVKQVKELPAREQMQSE